MNYFVLLNDVRKGPYTLEELAEKYITADVLVWREGMDDWKKAGEMEELQDIVKQLPPPPPHFKLLKNWLSESIMATGFFAILSYLPMFQFCIIALPFGGIAIYKALKVEELHRKGQQEMARHYADEARKWITWCVFAGLVALIFVLIGMALLFILGAFLWEQIPFQNFFNS